MKYIVPVIAVAILLAGCAATQAPPAEPAPAQPTAAPVYAAPKHHPVGTKGMKALQHALAAKGYYHGKIDGVNGARTRNAVARYQQDLGVTPTGDVDEQTWSSLGLSEGN